MIDVSRYKMRETETHVYFHGGPLSNWFLHAKPFQIALPIVVEDAYGRRLKKSDTVVTCNCGEQAMMASKASIFGDTVRLNAIMGTSNPQAQKNYGASVSNYVDAVWSKVRKTVVTIIGTAHFAQDNDLHDYLMSTADKKLVEGALRDTIWGVGLSWDDPKIENEVSWRGTNLLGVSREDTRTILREFGRDVDPWAAVSTLVRSRVPFAPSP